MTPQDQKLALVTGVLATVVAGAVTFGMSIGDVATVAPTPIEAAMESAGRTVEATGSSTEMRMEDMPSTGQSEINTHPAAPGETVTAAGELPDSWSWGGHLVLIGDAYGKFSVSDAHVEIRDGHQWIVATATNQSGSAARFDALFDYSATAPIVDAGTD